MKELLAPAEVPPLRGTPRLELPRVETASLPNGLQVRVARREGVPLAAVRLLVRGGRSLDGPARAGCADLLAAALKEGSAARTGVAIAEALRAAGASLETGADEDALWLSATPLAGRLEEILAPLGEVVAAPGFRAADVERVKALAREELVRQEAEPTFLAERALRRAIYPGHPYAAVSPDAAAIQALSPASLAQAARRALVPSRSVLFVVGSVEPDAAFAAAARAFGAWKGAAEGELPAPAPPRARSRIVAVARPGSVQTVLLAGAPAPSRRSPDGVPLLLANTVYGGAFTSRLVENLREEKGYTYSPRSRVSWRRLGGPFTVEAAVRNEVTGAALNEILYELRRMATTDAAEEELERARNREVGALSSALQTNAGLALELARLAADDLPAEELASFVARLPACTPESVRAAAARHLAAPGLVVAAVGERETIRRELACFDLEISEEPS